MLRQPRYAALSALMLLVATVCVLAGTWQIVRLEGKVGANDELRHNAHAAAAPVASVLPAVGSSDGPPRSRKIQFRTVRASGRYDAVHQALVRQRIVDDSTGFYVLTPLHTADGTLLVVRGFMAGDVTTVPPAIPAPPGGTVAVTARVEPGESRHDQAGKLAQHQLESINPGDQAARLGGTVFDGYAELVRGQPGTAGLTPIPTPDLSNPAGGAIEPQHLAYIIQWYLFALLALGAPIAMIRAETRQRDDRDFDQARDPAAEPTPDRPDRDRAARLAERYGRAVRR